jgi:AcrR family transcriptional regulator
VENFQENQKYLLILKTAHDLFWKFGIRRVSIEEVCREAGVSKMTFYRFFDNKIELAKVVLAKIVEDGESDYLNIMAQDIPFEEKIKEQVRLKFEGTREISRELVKDIYSDWNPEIKAFWEQKTNQTMQLVVDDFTKAIEKGWIRKDVKLEFVLYLSQKMGEMIADPTLIAMYENVQGLIMEMTNLLFYGILPRNDK